MTNSKSKTYTSEFKESAVKLANESRQSVDQTARELGITKTTQYAWVKKYSRP